MHGGLPRPAEKKKIPMQKQENEHTASDTL